MKNLKVRLKLLIGFIIVAALTLVVGFIGIISLNQLDVDYTYALETHGKPLEDAGHMLADLHAIRAEIRAAMLFTGDATRVQNQAALTQEFMDDFEARAAAYGPFVISADSQALFNEAIKVYNEQVVPAVETTLANAMAGVPEAELTAYMVNVIKPAIDTVTNNIGQSMTNKGVNLDIYSAAGTALYQQRFLIMIIVMVVAAIGAVLLGLYIAGLISKPLAPLTRFMKKAGLTGDLTLEPAEKQLLGSFSARKDELGETIAACASFVDRIGVVSENLEIVANGDLSTDISLLSEKDSLGHSLHRMVENLNNMFGNINISSAQVSTGSAQVADGAQALAAGATEQAAAIEQLSSSIAELSAMARANNSNTSVALTDIRKSEQLMTVCVQQMHQMLDAMRLIDEKSANISKTTKVIDDIAFQTNILALNAAVEAARAGQHGKGFAVVAEEVRNLASKSASAAKETQALIESSSQSVSDGNTIVGKVNESLQAVAEIAQKNATQIAEVQSVSAQQSEAMEQVNQGIDQISQVVQQNSATAQESAAASQQMSSQSAMLRDLISQFKLKGAAGGYAGIESPSQKRLSQSGGSSYIESNPSRGKY